ncbi:pyrroline-5-carboxylate reductase [Candidatus Falkowbacteria bacterium CG_4_9_14_3_um_filter_36_9]|nr:MAG: pyrroline-5-carboxylate reductase [Candidatus Falkowbacteria bacterium CG_4_8_14_3_um_filter_36_11]PJA10654.1 MAG: pyrroline-5-carboxylate reductase [Candidatus Falkowbacteria bacterium CG_4_10_14_0_2_um_filter_36_22]PJB18260.1 MAG: pyrroline-5-carboxylate reductase [Candidatus Falkowbacteria bacterium CG_4_9_14_3_um_filter_36_9]
MRNSKKNLNIGILGFGHMGEAIFRLLKKIPNLSFNICSLGVKKITGAVCVESIRELVEKSNPLFLCIKPQEFYSLNRNDFPEKTTDKIIISIMAGVCIKNIKKITGQEKIVRTMPNLPLQVGEGVIGWHANKKIFKRSELKEIETLLLFFGKKLFVKKENAIDSLTAISGSGPAYVFLFAEALIRSAVYFGFTKEQSQQIVLQTIKGSLAYIDSQEKNFNLEKLIAKIKSKKGTTEAALNEIGVKAFYDKWLKATSAAGKRANELSSYEIK